MPRNRLLHLDRFSGHIDRVDTFHSSDDAEAICRVEDSMRAHPAELWSPAGKVSRFDGLPEIAQPRALPAMARSDIGGDAEI